MNIKWHCFWLAFFVILYGSILCCYSQDLPKEKVIRAMIGEAASEGFDGMVAISCAIRNRGTLKGVYGLNAKHVDNEPRWVWQMAERAYYTSFDKDVTNGATHWESTNFKVPYWAKDMTVTAKIGKHIFYKE